MQPSEDWGQIRPAGDYRLVAVEVDGVRVWPPPEPDAALVGAENNPDAPPSAAGVEDYVGMTQEEIARLVLYLLSREALEGKLISLPETVRKHAHRHRAGGSA